MTHTKECIEEVQHNTKWAQTYTEWAQFNPLFAQDYTKVAQEYIEKSKECICTTDWHNEDLNGMLYSAKWAFLSYGRQQGFKSYHKYAEAEILKIKAFIQTKCDEAVKEYKEKQALQYNPRH